MFNFVVFSFNRAEFLRHCISSIERCAAGFPILIVDDNSNDADTIRLLEQLALRHRIVQPEKGDTNMHSKHGGLYNNMQLALDSLQDGDLLCTLQDDMQLVRHFPHEEAIALEQWFLTSAGHGFVHHAFLKGSERQRSRISFDASEQMYYNKRVSSSAGAWYSDIFIASVTTLRQAGWRFQSRESLNEEKARKLFLPMAHCRDPFVAWLPAANSWRGKRRTLALRLGEKKNRCGFYPLDEMDEATSFAFKARDPGVLPYAEDFLRVRRQSGNLTAPDMPWIYHPLQGNRWLKWLNSLEIKLMRKHS